MNEHVAKVVELTEQKIRELQMLVADLIEVFGPYPGGAMEQTVPAVGGRATIADGVITTERLKAKRESNAKTPRGKGAKGSGGKVQPETMRIADWVAGMVEPFTAKQIAALAKLDWKKASNFVTQGKVKGWLKGTGRGQYVRTLKFPVLAGRGNGATDQAATPKHEVLPAPGHRAVPGRTRGIVEAELKKACEDRDEQRAASRTTMEAIAQKRVDRLEEELEGMGS